MTELSVSPEELRLIAVYREIRSYNKPHILAQEDAGAVTSLLKKTVPDLESFEKDSPSAEVRAFLRGFIRGIAAANLSSSPYELSAEEQTAYVGGPTGGAAVGQGVDERYVTNTGPQN